MAKPKNSKFVERMQKLAHTYDSDQAFADKLDVSRQTLGFWLKGQRSPNMDMLMQVSDKLNMSIDYLVGKSESNSLDAEIQSIVRATGLTEESIKTLNKPVISNGSSIINKLVESGKYKELENAFMHLLQVALAVKDDTPIVPDITVGNESLRMTKKEFLDICSQRIGNIFSEQIKDILLEYSDIDPEYRSFLAIENKIRNLGLSADQLRKMNAENPNELNKLLNDGIEV